MKIKFSHLLFSTIVFLTTVESANACPTDNQPINSANDLLQCILQNHPELKRSQVELKQADYLEAVAEQRPNPELAMKAVSGKVGEENQVNTETSLTHTFELGGKRSARIERAKASKFLKAAEITKSQEDIIVNSVLDLFRLKQLSIEKKIIAESLSTYTRVLDQMRRRPKLTPDLEVSSEIFQLAQDDYKLKDSMISSDIESIKKSIEFTIGGQLPDGDSFLPQSKDQWPSISESIDGEIKSSEFKKSLAEKSMALAELESAKSESWPDLKIGPDLETESSAGTYNQRWGVTLSFPFPLFNINGAGRSYAKYGAEAADLKFKQTKSLLENQRIILIAKYKKSIGALSASKNVLELSIKKKKYIEGLYNRGLISSSQLIESQRQLLEYVKSRNETELDGIETLWRVHAIDGKLLEEKL